MLRIQCQRQLTGLPRFQLLRHGKGREIGRQVQHIRHHRLRTIINNIDNRLRMVTLIHIIKLRIVNISQDITKRMRIHLTIVFPVLKDHTFHGQPYRFLGATHIDSSLFAEMSQHTGIIGQRNLECLTATYTLLRIFHLSTSTIRFHTCNSQMTSASVFQFKRRRDRHLKARLSNIDSWLIHLHSLRRYNQRGHTKAYYY